MDAGKLLFSCMQNIVFLQGTFSRENLVALDAAKLLLSCVGNMCVSRLPDVLKAWLQWVQGNCFFPKLANKCGVKDFIVESVHSLTKEPNPWSRSFKVCVPARLEEQMHNPQMYPASWESRAFTQWPSR